MAEVFCLALPGVLEGAEAHDELDNATQVSKCLVMEYMLRRHEITYQEFDRAMTVHFP